MPTTTSPNVEHAMKGVLSKLRSTPSPERRVRLAQDIYDQLTAVQQLVVTERRGAVREMREAGMTLQAIADKLGLSVSRVKQMEDGPRKDTATIEQQVARLQRRLEREQAQQEAS